MKRITEDQNDPLAALIRAAGRRAAPPSEDYERVLSAATAAWRAKVGARRRKRWALAAAAGVAIVAVTLMPLLERAPQPLAVATPGVVRGAVSVRAAGEASWRMLSASGSLDAGTLLRTGADGRVSLALRSGVEVRVHGATELRMDSVDRLTLTAGILYVDSGALTDPGSLTVATRFGELRDIGTQFEASVAADDLRVRVREGRVVLDQDGLRLESEAGHQLTIDAAGQAVRTAFRTDDPAWAWAERLAAPPDVAGKSVRDVLAWVARETGRSLRFETPATELQARIETLHGTMSLQELTPIEALDVVMATTTFDYIIQDDGAILVRRR